MNELSQTLPSEPLALESPSDLTLLTPSQVVDKIALLLQSDEIPERKEYETLYSAFYKIKKHKEPNTPEEMEQLLLQEARLNDLNSQYRTLERKRSEALAALQLANGEKAEAILNELEVLLASGADFKVVYERFHEIRKEWESLRPLTQQDESRLGKRFVTLRDAFYELKDINTELRDYDYRKNLEQKQQILEELRVLEQSEDIVAALATLSNSLVLRWRDIGPVAPEHRAEINGTYKTLSTSIFKRHQAYQEGLKAGEEQNAKEKEGLIEKAKAFLAEERPTTAIAWNTVSDEIKALQEKWKTIGSAGRKSNGELYQAFRAVCNDFFEAKQDFFKSRKSEAVEGIALRKQLIERAVALAESNHFVDTVAALTKLQEEWKQLPHLRKSDADPLWQEFRKPFETFYQRKKEYDRKQHHIEKANEEKKRALLGELKAFVEEQELPERLKDKLIAIKESWRKIGRAGAKVNDDLWAEFCSLNDTLYERLRSLHTERRSEQLKERRQKLAESPRDIKDELQVLQRKAERLRTELRNYENNINFLTSTSKGANPLLKEIERKQQRLAESLERVEEEIRLFTQES